MEFARVRRLSAGEIVLAGGEDVGGCTASPAVAFFGRVGFVVIGFQVTVLGATVPEVVPFEKGVDVVQDTRVAFLLDGGERGGGQLFGEKLYDEE